MTRIREATVGMFLAACVLVGPLAATDLLAEGKACVPAKKIMLFNGKDLTGLKAVSRPPKGGGKAPVVWTVADGVLKCAGQPFGYIRTEGCYTNYRMHIEWRWPAKAGNSGVLLHSIPPDGVFPRCVEAQLMSGKAGDIYLFKGATIAEVKPGGRPSRPKAKDSSEKPLGQWNCYDIVCEGDSVKLYVNDVLQNSATKASPSAGWICLQSEGAPIEFRNWYVEPVGKAPAKPTTGETGAVKLFNGKDLTGWVPYLRGRKGQPAPDPADTWTIKDGVIHCAGKPAGYIRTAKEYSDYVLKVEWRWPGRGGNSGVLLHASGEDKVWPNSLEAQLKTGNAGVFFVISGQVDFKEHKDKASKRVRGRRTEKLAATSEKKLGEWNQYEIRCEGNTVTVKVNGVLQNQATDLTVTKGWICLQSEGTPIEFRNITLEPIKK